MTTARDVIARAVGNWEGNPGCRDEYEETADSILTALQQAGYVIVPMEPTKEMIEAGQTEIVNSTEINGYGDIDTDPNCARNVYGLMLATKPSA